MSNFEFKTEIHLTKIMGLSARSLSELYEGIKVVGPSSIYYHTHRFLKQHQFISPEPPNDFAYWIKNSLGLDELAEKLSSIDIVEFYRIEDLRRAILTQIQLWLSKNGNADCHDLRKKFHFMSCQTFVFSTGYVASNIKEFVEILKIVDINSIYFHIFEARMRLKKEINDFQSWLSEIGRSDLANKLSNLDPYNITLENLRKKIIKIIEEGL